ITTQVIAHGPRRGDQGYAAYGKTRKLANRGEPEGAGATLTAPGPGRGAAPEQAGAERPSLGSHAGAWEPSSANQSLAMDTSVDLTKAITSLPTCNSSSRTERVVITEVTMPAAVCTSISDRTSPMTISLIEPLNWLRTLMALMVM